MPGELTVFEGPDRRYGHNLMTGEGTDRVSLGEDPSLLLRKQLFQSNNSGCSWQATKLGCAIGGGYRSGRSGVSLGIFRHPKGFGLGQLVLVQLGILRPEEVKVHISLSRPSTSYLPALPPVVSHPNCIIDN